MFRRQHNESPYGKSVTVTEMVFTKWTLAGQLFVMNRHSELHENSADGYIPTLSTSPDVKYDCSKLTIGIKI